MLLDGRILGDMSEKDAAILALKLRTLKALGKEKVSFLKDEMLRAILVLL